MNLTEMREQIDIVDDKIAALYCERMAIVKEIGKEKAKEDKIVQDRSREKSIINRVTKNAPYDIKMYTKQVMETLFETSRAYQNQYLTIKSPIRLKIESELIENTKKFPIEATVACQGLPGAYSNLATEKLFPLCDITYVKTFEGVFQAVEKGLCKYGVLPIENSTAGSVNEVYDLMKKHNFYIIRSIKMKISHALLAKDKIKLTDIKEIYSHEQALNQCKELIKKLKNVTVNVCANTAVASKLVADSDRRDIACIASESTAEIYGLNILATSIEDQKNNYTRFICISKNLEIFKPNNKISIMVSLPHESGSLNKVLNKFYTLGMNLTKLESRPLVDQEFEFMFYFDLEANIEHREVISLLAELENGVRQFTFLGSYTEV